MKQIAHILLLVLLLGVIAGEANAYIRQEGVKVRIDGSPRAAEAGKSFEGILNFHALGDHMVRDISVGGTGWDVVIPAPLGEFTILRGDVISLPFIATPIDANQPLVVEWQWDGRQKSKLFDLSREYMEKVRLPMAMNFARGEVIDPSTKDVPRWERLVSPTESSVQEKDPPLSQDRADPIVVEGTVVGFHTPSSVQYAPLGATVWVFISGRVVPYYGYTDEDGNFSVEVYPTEGDPEPDIQVAFLATNAHINVRDDDHDSDAWITYCPIHYDVSGPVHDYGSVISTSDNFHKAFYIAETTRRGWEYYNYERGFNTSDIVAHYPSDEADTFWRDNKMWIGRVHGWNEGVILHEYGHHWADDFCAMPSFDYCNGACDDDPPDDCSHCVWCEESHEVAWNEGIANFISRMATDYIADSYSCPHPDSLIHMGIETISDGEGCPWPPAPFRTEGHFAAQLYDLADVDTDCDDHTPGLCDVAVGWADEVFEVITNSCPEYGHYPRSPQQFSTCFKERFPELGMDFWETSRNCDIYTDSEDPGYVTIEVTIPGIWSPTADNTITVYWTQAPDDLSGVAGYSISWTLDDPEMPNETMDIGVVPGVVSDPLEPGDYWFNIRAVDRADNWSTSYRYAGPFQIIEGEGADLKYDVRAGWDEAVVPTKNTDSVEGNVQVSINLDGDEPNTYWNVAGKNRGDATSVNTAVSVSVDGEELDSEVWPLMTPGSVYRLLNKGPVTVPAGRHMFSMYIDSDEVNAEPIEVNNYRSGQWAWRPLNLLPPNTLTQYGAPTLPAAGFESFGWEQPAFYNCDGHRVGSHTTYQAVYMYPYPTSGQVNYDLRIFGPEALPETAYYQTIGESLRPGGYLESVLVYGLNQGLDACHVGVYNWENGGGTVGYRLNVIEDEYIGTNYGTFHTQLYDQQMMKIYSFVPNEPLTLKLVIDPGSPPMYLGFFDGEFATGGLMDAMQIEEARDDSVAVITIDAYEGSLCAAVIWRELDGQLYSPKDATLIIEPHKPDLVAEAPSGWVAPLTPYPNHDPVYPWPTLPAPYYLIGGVSSTYLYFGGKNMSDVACTSFHLRANLDGDDMAYYDRPGVDAYDEFKFTGAPSYLVWGGRHILSLELDSADEVEEEFESNNNYGRQWAWSPSTMYWDNPLVIDYLSDALGGFELVTDGPAYYNCTGWQTDELYMQDDHFASFFSLCDAETDVDIRVYDDYLSAENGFGTYKAASSFGNGEADFIIVDVSQTYESAYTFGLLEVDGDGDAHVEFDVSGSTVHYDPGSFSDSLQAGEYTELYWLSLSYGAREVRLIPDAGNTVDLGISLVLAGTDYSNRFDLSEHFSAWVAEPGEDEIIELTAPPQGGSYALLVWKADAAQAGVPCGFTISMSDVSSDVEADSVEEPLVTRLLPAMPNPFDAQTTLSFDLAQPEDVRLRIFDVAGAVVHEYQPGVLSPGRHHYVWNGRRKSGNPISSGIYYARLESGKGSFTKKVIHVE